MYLVIDECQCFKFKPLGGSCDTYLPCGVTFSRCFAHHHHRRRRRSHLIKPLPYVAQVKLPSLELLSSSIVTIYRLQINLPTTHTFIKSVYTFEYHYSLINRT